MSTSTQCGLCNHLGWVPVAFGQSYHHLTESWPANWRDDFNRLYEGVAPKSSWLFCSLHFNGGPEAIKNITKHHWPGFNKDVHVGVKVYEAPVRRGIKRTAPSEPTVEKKLADALKEVERLTAQIQELREEKKHFKALASRIGDEDESLLVIVNEAEGFEWLGLESDEELRALFDEIQGYLRDSAPNARMTKKALFLGSMFLFKNQVSARRLAPSVGTGFSDRSLQMHFNSFIDDVQAWANGQVRRLSNEELLAESKKNTDYPGGKYSKIILFHVDGSVSQTYVPGDCSAARVMRNTKHNMHSWTWYIIVSSSGKILYVSEVEGGSIHDKTHLDNDQGLFKLAKWYGGKDGHLVINGSKYQLCMCGDKAYPRAKLPPGWRGRVTKSGEQTNDVNDDGEEIEGSSVAAGAQPPADVDFDPEVAKLRGVVERVICLMKTWGIMTGMTHMTDQTKADKIVRFVAALVNWTLRRRKITQV